MPDINDMLRLSYKTLNELQLKLGQLNEVHKDIVKLKEEATKGNAIGSTIPIEFKNKFEEIKKLSHQYLTDINAATNKYFEVNSKIYTDNQNLFVEQIKNLQDKNNELKTQIERLEKVDLDRHFKELQKILSEIFNAINAINLTFTNIVQTLTGIVQSLSATQTSIELNHKETKQILNSLNETNENRFAAQDKQLLIHFATLNNFQEVTKAHLMEQDTQTEKNIAILDIKINSLQEQNLILKKELKTNLVIAIVGLAFILILCSIITFKILFLKKY